VRSLSEKKKRRERDRCISLPERERCHSDGPGDHIVERFNEREEHLSLAM
jgi:hypothetical protein